MNKTQDPVDPLEVMKQAFKQKEVDFSVEEDMLRAHFTLNTVEVELIACSRLSEVVHIVVRIPVRAPVGTRAAVGEFMHRLNFGCTRKLWELDYSDGEIRIGVYTDTMLAPLVADLFLAMVAMVLNRADTVFPYLTSVISGRMTPEFAADQAEAAFASQNDEGETSDEQN